MRMERFPGRIVNNLTKRILFAVPAAVLFLGMIWLGGWYFLGMILVLGLLVQSELIKLLDKAGHPADTLFPYTIGIWVMLSHRLPYVLEIGLGILILFLTIHTFRRSEYWLQMVGATFFAGIYAPVGFLSMLRIHEMGDEATGFILTVALVFMVWGNDVFAYFGGKWTGKRPLAPTISPNKTVEGFLFGYAGSIAGLALVMLVNPYPVSFDILQLLPVAMLVATFGPAGDLIESKIKRLAGQKDSSNILPGHGGFFDRFDALLIAAPAAYIYLSLLL